MSPQVTAESFTGFLDDPKRIVLDSIAGNGAAFGSAIVSASRLDVDRTLLNAVTETLPDGDARQCFPALREELEVLFRCFQRFGWDFGFRVGKEISRFICFHRQLSRENWNLNGALDAQIVQKLMPKLNGSEGRLSSILKALSWYCSGLEKELHEGNTMEGKTPQERAAAIIKKVEDSPAENPKKIYESLPTKEDGSKGTCPLSMEKTVRMWDAVKINGFTSFAEN